MISLPTASSREITPDDANTLGYKLAMEFTKGRHQFVVSTHVDKAHIHTHIEFNSVNLECDGKFNNFKDSSFALRRLNDQICREHGYSVIEKPKAGELYPFVPSGRRIYRGSPAAESRKESAQENSREKI